MHPLLRLRPSHLPGSKASARTPAHVTKSCHIDSPFIFESLPHAPVLSITATHAPSLPPASSDSPGRWPWRVLGSRVKDSRQFEAAFNSAGVTKGGDWTECTAEKEEEKEKEPAKDGPSSPKREDDARARGGPA